MKPNKDKDIVTGTKLESNGSTVQQEHQSFPLFLTDDVVIFPGIFAPLLVRNEDDAKLVNDVLSTENRQMVVALKKNGQGG